MIWIDSIQKALNYIEDHLTDDIDVESTAAAVFMSSSQLQKIFSIITGMSVGDYIRSRRLSLAGRELHDKGIKVIDAALKYGYDTPESFNKAFTRFHGVSPSAARREESELKYFCPMTIEIILKGGYTMSRKLIPNVIKLYEIPSENYMFPSCMRSAMAALDKDPSMDFVFFAGVTGDLFAQTWGEPKWQYNDSYSTVCREDTFPLKAAFDACGYDFEYIPREHIIENKTKMVRRVVDSIDRGLPVLTFGIVGPPVCSIICGYDENGEVLIGWSQFTDDPIEPSDDLFMDAVYSEHYFQKRNGLDESYGLVFFGGKKELPSIADCYRSAIINIPVFGKSSVGEKVLTGKAAYDAWADSLLFDEEFIDEQSLICPLDTYGSCVVLTGTNMHYMQEFLTRAEAHCPDMKAHIGHLREKFTRMNDEFKKLIEIQGGFFFDADRRALLDRSFRERLSEQVRLVGRLYDEAVNTI